MPSVPMRGNDSINATKLQEKAKSAVATGPSTFNMLFDELSLVCLPFKSWGYRRTEIGDIKSIVQQNLDDTITADANLMLFWMDYVV